MMEAVQPPLFVFNDGDLTVLAGVESLCRTIEPWDVSDQLEVFDVSGAALRLHAEGVLETRFTVGGGKIVIDGLDPQSGSEVRFRELLRKYVFAVGTPKFGLESDSLDQIPLRQFAEQVASFFQQRGNTASVDTVEETSLIGWRAASEMAHQGQRSRWAAVIVTGVLLGVVTAAGFIAAGVSLPLVLGVVLGGTVIVIYVSLVVLSYRHNRRAGLTRRRAIARTGGETLDPDSSRR